MGGIRITGPTHFFAKLNARYDLATCVPALQFQCTYVYPAPVILAHIQGAGRVNERWCVLANGW